MTLRKRSLLYLIRKRGRTILFLLFLFTIACILQVGGSLKSNADQEEKELRESLGSGFILKADTENESYYELRSKKGHAYNLYTGPRVTDEVINQILKIPGVIDYEVSLLDFVWTDLSLKAGAWAADMEPDEYFTKEQLELFSQKTRIYPCRKGEQNKNFWTGAFKISKGRNIQEGDHHKAVISEWLAKKNGLTIGDTFIVESKEGLLWGSKEPFNTLGLPIELEIVGLFQPNFQQEESDATYEDGYVVNQIFTDLNTHASLQKNIGEEDKGLGYTEVTFFVKDPAKLESIMQQIRENEQIDIEGMIFKADDAAYQASVKPFHLISLFSSSIIVIGLIGMGIILYLVVKFWIKGRMGEVGIYLSIGIGKRKIIGQMLLECLMISATAILISLILSGPMVKRCTRAAEQIASPKIEKEAYVVRLRFGSDPEITKNSSDEVHLEDKIPETVRLFTALAVCGISCFSVLLGSIQLLDIEPKKLLQSIY